MNKRRKGRGIGLMTLGLLLIAAALVLTGYNIWDERRAEEASEKMLEQMELPVMSEWSYPKLKIAPCRYKGSAYTHNLIIAGHNYRKHFSPIKSLEPGERIVFTDAEGNQFFYQVDTVEILKKTAVEQMEAGEWDLTLFTCTYGGQTRFTLRCILEEES